MASPSNHNTHNAVESDLLKHFHEKACKYLNWNFIILRKKHAWTKGKIKPATYQLPFLISTSKSQR